MTGFALKAVIVALVVVLIVALVARAFRRTDAAPAAPPTRAPMALWLSGAVLLLAGFVLALVSFASRYTADLLPLRVAAVAVFLVGVALVALAAARVRRRGR